jgi:hypothetical protein
MPERGGGAEHLEGQHPAGHTVVERGNVNGLLVDHVVEAVHVEARRAGDGRIVQRLPRETPESALQRAAVGSGTSLRGAARMVSASRIVASV